MLNIKISPRFSIAIWASISIVFMLFIWFLCYLYPLGGDEYSYYPSHANDILQGYILSYLTNGPRIGIIPARIVLFFGKDAFNIINPIIQLIIALLCFFTVFLRMPDFKILKDLPAFLLILVLSIFAIAQPDNNIFWIGGASNYNWPLLLFLPLIILTRLLLKGREVKWLNYRYSNILCFIAAFFIGMSGETFAPIALMLTIITVVCLKLRRLPTPKWLKIIIAGIIIGIIIFFTAPGLYFRLNMEQYNQFNTIPLYIKALNHLPVLAKACAANLLLFQATLIILIFVAIRNKSIKNKDFLFPLVMLFLALSAACALALAPIKNLRPFYPASVLTILAFVSALTLIKGSFKYAFYIFFTYAALVLPIFIMPFFSLHTQELLREEIINNAIKKGQSEVYLSHFITTKGPYTNLSIYFYDDPAAIRSKYAIVTQPADKLPLGQSHIKQY